jgi:hypothetical protein
MRQSALWSQAGRIYHLTEGPVWWAEVPERQWPEGVREVLDKVGSAEFGDRQQVAARRVDVPSPATRRPRGERGLLCCDACRSW